MPNKNPSQLVQAIAVNSGDFLSFSISGHSFKVTADTFARFLNNAYFLQQCNDPYFTDVDNSTYGRFRYVNGNFLVSGNLRVEGALLANAGISGNYVFNDLGVNALTVSGHGDFRQNASFKSGAGFLNGIDVTGNSIFQNNVTFVNGFIASAPVYNNAYLYVKSGIIDSGIAVFGGNITGSGDLTIRGGITGYGDILFHHSSGDRAIRMANNLLAGNSLTVAGGKCLSAVNGGIAGALYLLGGDGPGLDGNVYIAGGKQSSIGTVYIDNANFSGQNGFQISYTGLISNLNSDMLDNQHGSYYLNLGNLTGFLNSSKVTGNINAANLTGTIPSGLFGSINATGNVRINNLDVTGTITYNKTGIVTNLDADMLDGQHGSYYRNAANLTGTLPVGMGGGSSGSGASISNTPPATAGDTGAAGNLAYDASYLYVCVATNTWKRVALSSW